MNKLSGADFLETEEVIGFGIDHLFDVDRLWGCPVEQVAKSVCQLRVQVVGHLLHAEITIRMRSALAEQKISGKKWKSECQIRQGLLILLNVTDQVKLTPPF